MKAKDPDFTQEELAYWLEYRNGALYWKRDRGPTKKAGTRAGGLNPGDGYRRVKLAYRLTAEHRIIWMLHHGQWPTNQLDHINGDKTDNRIENLRPATNSQNLFAAKQKSRLPTTGIRGVHATPHRKYAAAIKHNKNRLHLGTFKTPEEASAAYRAAAKKLFGDFAPKA